MKTAQRSPKRWPSAVVISNDVFAVLADASRATKIPVIKLVDYALRNFIKTGLDDFLHVWCQASLFASTSTSNGRQASLVEPTPTIEQE